MSGSVVPMEVVRWFYNFADEQLYEGPDLAPPPHHPVEQATRGPQGRVPGDWRLHLL